MHYTYKSGTFKKICILLTYTLQGGIFMSTRNHYDEDFKRTLVEFYHNGKTHASLIKEYGISQSAFTKWIKQYSTVETESGEVITAKQVKDL